MAFPQDSNQYTVQSLNEVCQSFIDLLYVVVPFGMGLLEPSPFLPCNILFDDLFREIKETRIIKICGTLFRGSPRIAPIYSATVESYKGGEKNGLKWLFKVVTITASS